MVPSIEPDDMDSPHSYRQSLLCDVTLIVDEHTEMSAHRAVLAAASPFFRAMFDPTMKPSISERVPLTGIAADILADIVGYLYTGDIKIGGANVHGLLETATLLQLPALRAACADTLSAHLTTDTCLRIRRLAKQHDCVTLLRQADDYIKEHWTEMDGSADFVRLMQGEPLIEPLTKLLLEAVNGPSSLLSSSSPRCGCGVVDGAENADLKAVDIKSPLIMADSKKPQIMTVISNKLTFSYDFEDDRWTKSHKKPSASSGYLLFHSGHKFCIKNYNDAKTTELYETHTGTWQTMQLNIKKASGRDGAEYVILNGTVYALGGDSETNAVDWFDTEKRCWQPAAPLSQARSLLGVIEMDGLLYVVGGSSTDTIVDNEICDTNPLRSAERYDASANAWQPIASMSVERERPALCVLDGKLYAVGSSKSVEAYDPQSNTWRKLADMSVDRDEPAAVAHAGELYVMGGTDDRTIEIYHPASDTWRNLNTLLPMSMDLVNVCFHAKQEREMNKWFKSVLLRKK